MAGGPGHSSAHHPGVQARMVSPTGPCSLLHPPLWCLLWALAIGHHQAFRSPNLILLVDTLAATVLYWFAFQRPEARSSWLEPGANRLPSRAERRLIRSMPVMDPRWPSKQERSCS